MQNHFRWVPGWGREELPYTEIRVSTEFVPGRRLRGESVPCLFQLRWLPEILSFPWLRFVSLQSLSMMSLGSYTVYLCLFSSYGDNSFIRFGPRLIKYKLALKPGGPPHQKTILRHQHFFIFIFIL